MNSNSNMESLTNGMARVNLGDGVNEPEQLLFKPPLESKAHKALDDIPRYLFRISVPSSDAKTNGIWVRSKAVRQNPSASIKDIFEHEDRETIAYQLNMHLRWWGNDHVEDNFVSWTSSLLFAIQYIYYRRFKDHDRPSLSDTELYVIDTTQFPKGTFMRDLDLMEYFGEYDTYHDYSPSDFNLKSFMALRNKSYYFGEYLSQGSLKIEGKFQMIPADTLFNNERLSRLQPKFAALYRNPEDRFPKLASAVTGLRKAIWPHTTRLLSSGQMGHRLHAVKEIVDNFAPSWRFPLSIYFAALAGVKSTKEDQGTAYDNIIFQFFRLETWNGQEHTGFQPFQFEMIAPDTMPELTHAQKLVQETHKHFQLTQALDCLEETQLQLLRLYVTTILSGNDVVPVTTNESNQALGRVGSRVRIKLHAVQRLCGRLVSANAQSLV